MGMTIAEKVLARNSGNKTVHPGQYVDAKIDRIVADEEFYRVHAAATNGGMKDGLPAIWDLDKVHVVIDHHEPPLNETQATRQQMIRELVKKYGVKYFQDMSCSVIHQFAVENWALPGELSLGSDSHSCAWGALNCVSSGMGEHELAYAMTFGELWFRVPQSIKIVLTGTFNKNTDPKDLMFYLAKNYSASFGLYKSLEFTGPGAKAMSMSQRLTCSVHAVELGAKFGLFEYDEKTAEFLERRSELKDMVKNAKPVSADPDANYEQVIEVNLSELKPLVAKPHNFENIGTLAEVKGTPIHQAQVGSCANGRLEDLRTVAEVLKGKHVHPNTRFLIQPASWQIYKDAMKEGLLEIFIDAGAQVLSPGCHLCLGMQGRLGNNENAITSTTRNHNGRLGGKNCKVYIANPRVVANAALAGEIVDISEEL